MCLPRIRGSFDFCVLFINRMHINCARLCQNIKRPSHCINSKWLIDLGVNKWSMIIISVLFVLPVLFWHRLTSKKSYKIYYYLLIIMKCVHAIAKTGAKHSFLRNLFSFNYSIIRIQSYLSAICTHFPKTIEYQKHVSCSKPNEYLDLSFWLCLWNLFATIDWKQIQIPNMNNGRTK